MQATRGEEVQLLPILDLTTTLRELRVSRPDTRGKGPSSFFFWKGGWVGPRAGLDTEDRGKMLYLCQGSIVQSVVRHYTA
jgi:hypothetical protein